MSSINPHATQIAAGSSGVANHQALSGSGSNGVFAGAGSMANFWDLIMSQFSGVENGQTIEVPTTGKQTPDQTLAQTKGDNPLALLQLALSSQTLDADGNIVLDTAQADSAKIERQLGLTNTIIDHIKSLMPDSAEQDGMMASVLGKLQAKSDTLRASLSVLEGGMIAKDTPVEDLPLPILIALGVNPAEITEVSERVQALQEKLGREITVEDLIAGVGGLIPATPEQAVIALKSPGTNASNAVLDAIDENAQPTDDLAARLNAMDVGAGDAAEDPEAGLTNTLKDGADSKKSSALSPEAEQTNTDGAKPDNNATGKKDNGNQNQAFRENLVNLLNAARAQSGDMTFPMTFSGLGADAAIYQSYGLGATPALGLGTAAQAANLVSSPAMAGQNHPASHMVAATLTKAGKGGEDSTINLRLDPPELGNVAVKLQFGKDKTVKAHLMVEKPETYMMLQRDGAALERALQSAGFDAQSQTISFELAQDNSAFRQGGNGNDANNFGGGGKASQDANGAEEILQSSMTWQVDPSTGHMRYNIMA